MTCKTKYEWYMYSIYLKIILPLTVTNSIVSSVFWLGFTCDVGKLMSPLCTDVGSSGHHKKAGWSYWYYIHHGGSLPSNCVHFPLCDKKVANAFPFGQVLIRLIGADEHLYSNYVDSMQWLESTDVLEMVVDKFSSSVCCIFDLNIL